jgi:hypothetical protein
VLIGVAFNALAKISRRAFPEVKASLSFVIIVLSAGVYDVVETYPLPKETRTKSATSEWGRRLSNSVSATELR